MMDDSPNGVTIIIVAFIAIPLLLVSIPLAIMAFGATLEAVYEWTRDTVLALWRWLGTHVLRRTHTLHH